MNQSNLDKLLQYVLLRAGELDDFRSRSLGPIHFIKYVYLADLYYYSRNGESFTGVDWKFHNFGPWSNHVLQQISPSLNGIIASKCLLESDFGNEDSVRWTASDEHRLNSLKREIPAAITLRLDQDIKNYSNDTRLLLDEVYKTSPMLNAVPGQMISFEGLNLSKEQDSESVPLRIAELSKKKKKDFFSKLNALKKKNDLKRAEQVDRKQLLPNFSPRYDEVYEQGLMWLDSIADGPVVTASEFIVEFDESIWKSDTRGMHDLP